MVGNEYAKALFELAEINALTQLDDELNVLCLALDQNPDAMKVLTYPNISLTKKKELIKNITVNCNELLVRFLYVVLDNNRFDEIKDIRNEFHKLVSNQSETVDVSVTSSTKLTDAQISKLSKTLSSRYEGRKININNIVDANLIGGVKVVANGECVDLSLSSKITSLKASL